ncbi:hypothetical protein DLAC_07602 [Tieghemostelium lacteum]|uniref:DUF4397 domain-containing protein n=1 Tax=Tieghemostelium lacteum TaxID=361077 RepID=A0A151ZCY2_TIELA|nr:hypothetical protein DLAC_07602 [Tieghemostelium lacteum]|eukprot:KYQ91807.1 hypothetical protein DLAC_07602 [Tieghemostelium lacteum]
MGLYFSNNSNSINQLNSSGKGICNNKNLYYMIVLSSVLLFFFTYGIQALHISNNNNLHLNRYNNQPSTIDQSLYSDSNSISSVEQNAQVQQQQQLEQQEPIIEFTKIKIINTLIHSSDDDLINIVFNQSFEISGISYLSVSEYIRIPVGNLHIVIQSHNNRVEINQDQFVIKNDSYYTLLISGDVSGQSNTKQSYKDRSKIVLLSDNNHFPITPKRTTIRFIHCSPDTPPVDLSIYQGATIFSNHTFIGTPVGNNNQFRNQLHSSTNFISIPIRHHQQTPYYIYVHQPENTSHPFMAPEALINIGAPVTTILLVGLQNSSTHPSQLVFVPYPIPSHLPAADSSNQNQPDYKQSPVVFKSPQSLISSYQQQFSSQQGVSNFNSLSPPSFLNFIVAVFSFAFLALLSFV